MELKTVAETAAELGVTVGSIHYHRSRAHIPDAEWVEGSMYYTPQKIEIMRRFYAKKKWRKHSCVAMGLVQPQTEKNPPE